MGAPRLLIPGPAPIDPRIMGEMAKPAGPHYGQEWVDKYAEVVDMLERLFQVSDSKIYPLAGPGHSAMDAIAFTLLRRGDRVAVVDNGFFGTRLAEVLRAHHLDVQIVASKWGDPPDLHELERVVRNGVKCVVAIHNETSTGMTNPIRAVSKIANDNGAWMFVDAVSSLAGIPLSCDAWGIDVCFAASQKALSAPPGIAPISIANRRFDEVDPSTAEGWYLNLATWDRIKETWGSWHPQPTTMSTNIFYSFHRALQLTFEEGLDARFRRHEVIGHAYREGLKALGFSLFCDEEYASNTVSSVRPPDGVDSMKLIEKLRVEDNIVIAGTLGPMRGQGIRIGHMGSQASREDLEAMLTALARHMKDAGVSNPMSAVDHAMQIAAKIP